jgi:hypothetical protein
MKFSETISLSQEKAVVSCFNNPGNSQPHQGNGLTLMAKYAKGAEKDLKQISNGGDQELARQAKAALECLDTFQCGMHRHGRDNRWYSVNP